MYSSRKALKVAITGVLDLLMVWSAPSAYGADVAGDRQAPLPQVSCGWPAVVSPTRLNFAFPESNAVYWLMPYQLGSGERIVAKGTYPFARFSSLTTYIPTGSSVDSLADKQIAANPGSLNPTTNANASNNPNQRKYDVTVRAGVAADSGGNTVAATTGSAATGSGWLVLRIYAPTNASDPTGGVPLPELSIQGSNGQTRTIPTCAQAGSTQGPAGPLADLARQLLATASIPGGLEGCGTSTAAAPGFEVPNKTGGLFPNPYNKYLCTPIDYKAGRIVVVRGLAPTFPDTQAGQSVLTNTQLRYWSLCQNQWRLPYPVSTCAADFQTTLDANKHYTYVVSTPQDRPANATAANNVTWLSWGPTNVTGLLIFRNMLPAANFPNAIQNVHVGQNPAATMGSYFPTVAYCTKATFTAGGPNACPAQ